MVGVIDVAVQAANPTMPLFPMRAFEGSPSSIRVRNVPKQIGSWKISKVYFSVAYPDNMTHNIECQLIGGVWVGTIEGCDSIGEVKNGYSIFADGVDENGNAVSDYCLGKGDIQILDARGITEPMQNVKFVQILSSEPSTPNEGDMWQTNGTWYVWQNGESWPLGDDSGLIEELQEQIDTIDSSLSILTSDVADIQGDVQEVEQSISNINTALDGKASIAQLNAKQDALSQPQIQAIDSVVDERATIVKYVDDTISTLNIAGELKKTDIPNIANAKEVKIGNIVTRIANSCFYECYTLTSVTIPDSVTSIGNAAFQNCESLTNATIPDSVTSIGYAAFRNCVNLTNVKIGKGLTSIPSEMFAECINLSDPVEIPEQITSIGEYAFFDCEKLPSVTIGSGVNYIESGVFSECTMLTSVTFVGKTTAEVQAMENYHWGVDTAYFYVSNNATQEWVNNQYYATQNWVDATYLKRPVFFNCSIPPRGTRKILLADHSINYFNIASSSASFAIYPPSTGGDSNYAVDTQLVMPVAAGVTQPITWEAKFTSFNGGTDPSVVAPEGGKTNIWHIIEIRSNEYAVIKEA